MKTYTWLVMLLVSGFLAACGGGGGSTGSNAVISPSAIVGPSVSELDAAKATLLVDTDKVSYQPAEVRGFLVHLSDGKQDVVIEKTSIKKVFWNSGVVGFHSVDATRGTEVSYDRINPIIVFGNPVVTLMGGNFSFLLDDGREVKQDTNPKWLIITTVTGVFAERRSDGLIYGSPIPAPTPSIPNTIVTINTVSGQIDITPAIVGKTLVNLVKNNPVETVLDATGQVITGYRIVWNDTNSWYPSHGTLAALLLPKTSITGATKPIGIGAGIPTLVRPDGSSVAFNTSLCTFVVNGAIATVNVDGLIHY